MAGGGKASRVRFGQYRQEARERFKAERSGTPAPAGPMLHGGRGDWRRCRSHQRQRSFWRLFREFWRLLENQRKLLIFALFTLSLSVLIHLLPPFGIKLIFDNVLTDGPVPGYARWLRLPQDRPTLLVTIVAAIIAIALIELVINIWSRWQATKVSKRVVVGARRRVFDHAVRLPLHRVYDLKSGGVASILRDDAGGVGELVFSMLYNPVRAIIQLLGTLVILTWLEWRLLVGAMMLLPIVWFTHKTWIARIRPIFRDIRHTRQGIDSHATEAFGGMRVVRSFGRQRSETGTFTSGNHLMARQELFAWWWMRGVDAAWQVLIPLATSILLLYGGLRILRHSELVAAGAMPPQQAFTIGSLVMFMTYLGSLLAPIATLANSATGFQNNLAGLDRALDLLDEPREMPDKPQAIRLNRDEVQGRITLRDVGFRYAQSDKTVLEGVSLDVLPGEMVAFVGPSGAGKTTLCNLIARFFDPTAGAILLDGVDLRDIQLQSYRTLLGIVEQDTFLFDGTIADNIAYGRRHATRDEIAHAARLANAHGFIEELPQGYDSWIGERGVKLSGGQRQRLTIARAILADPKILILDEATSNLDTESERLIQASLLRLMAGRTSFVIAHRLSTISGADRIVVLEHGRVVEQGTHEQLMLHSGRYREMVDLQTRPAAPAEDAPDDQRVAMASDS